MVFKMKSVIYSCIHKFNSQKLYNINNKSSRSQSPFTYAFCPLNILFFDILNKGHSSQGYGFSCGHVWM